MPSNAENVSIWWRHHAVKYPLVHISQAVYVLIIQIFKNSVAITFKIMYMITSQVCTCHASSAVVTRAILCPDCITIIKLEHQDFSLKILVMMAPVCETDPWSTGQAIFCHWQMRISEAVHLMAPDFKWVVSVFSRGYDHITLRWNTTMVSITLQWRHNERDGVSNHRRLHCLLNRFSGADQRKHQSSSLYNGCNYLSILGLKLNHISKRGHWCHQA